MSDKLTEWINEVDSKGRWMESGTIIIDGISWKYKVQRLKN